MRNSIYDPGRYRDDDSVDLDALWQPRQGHREPWYRQVSPEMVPRLPVTRSQRKALKLISQGLTQVEVAGQLGVTQGAVSHSLRDALRRLRKLLSSVPLPNDPRAAKALSLWQAGLNQAQIALKVHCSQATVSRILSSYLSSKVGSSYQGFSMVTSTDLT
jgi:predicted transcriptional regulator